MNDQSKTAACYVRVSTPGQEQEQTIESQLDEIKRRVAEDGYHLADEHIYVDDGWTSEMLRRPDLDRMRDAAHDRRFQVVYVYDLGRLSRVYVYQEIILEELRNMGIDCISLHDTNDPSDEGQALRAMQGVFHQYERVKITERLRRGKMYKAREGKLISGSLPYGYMRIPKSEGCSAYASVNEQQAEHVRMIRQWFGQEVKSIYSIRQKLHELGIRSPKGGEYWSICVLSSLLKCEAYHTGFVYYNKTESVVSKKPRKNVIYRRVKRTSRKSRPRDQWIPIAVPKIVPNDGLYEKILARLEENKKNAQRNRKYPYLFSGKVMCGCGMHRVGTGDRAYRHYYRCAGMVYNYPLHGKCRIPGVRAEVLDELVWNALARLIGNPEHIDKDVDLWIEQNGQTAEGRSHDLAFLENKVAKVQEEAQRYAMAYGAGDLEPALFRQLMQETKRRQAAYQKQLDDLKSLGGRQQQQTILSELPEEVKQLIKSLDQEDKHQVVRKIVDKVVVLPDHQVKAHVSVPISAHKVALQNEYLDPQFAIPSLHIELVLSVPNLRRERWAIGGESTV